MFKQLDKPTRTDLKTAFGDDFIDLWNQDKVTCWLEDNGWAHIANVFQDQHIYGERFFQITLAELVQILPRRITTYAERRRLLNDIRTLGAANEMGSLPTNISINTDLHLFATTTNSSSPDNPSPSLPSAETPTSGHLPNNSPTTPSSASRALTTGPPAITSTIMDHQQHNYQYHHCHSRHGSDVSNSSSHYLHYTSSSVDSPPTTVARQSTHKHHSPTRTSYSPKGAFAKFRNSFLSRTNSSNITIPTTTVATTITTIATDTLSQRRHPSPINTNIIDISADSSSTSLSSPPLISPRVSSMNYDVTVLQQKPNNDDGLSLKQPFIPTRISSTPDKVSKFWANYSHWHGNNASSPSQVNNTSQLQQGLTNNASTSVIPAKNSPPAPSAHPVSLQKKFDQRIQITGDKETWYSLNVKNIYNVDQLKDHILTRMKLPGDRDDYCYFHENGYESSTPLDDHALMYLCSVADHSASDRILVISHSSSTNKKGVSSIYNISTNTLSTPELGYSPSDASSLSSPCAIRGFRSSHASYNHSNDLFATATLKSSSQGQSPRSNTRLRPLCRHTASASRLKLDGPPIIGVQLSDPPPSSPLSTSSSPFNIYETDDLPPTHSPIGMDLRHSSDPTSSHTPTVITSAANTDKSAGLWAIPPKEKHTNTTTTNASSPTVVLDGSMDLYDLIHPMTPISAHPITGLSPMEPYSTSSFPTPFIPPTETSPSPPLSTFSFNSTSRLVDNINDNISSPAEDEHNVDQFWGERPPAEVVCQNMEKYFDDHDLDKEVVVPPATPISVTTPPSGNNNLADTSNPKPNGMPTLSPSHLSSSSTSATSVHGLRRHTKSIRVVAREASKKYQSSQRQLRRPSLSVSSSSSSLSLENGRRATSFTPSTSTPLSSSPTQTHLIPPPANPTLLQPPSVIDTQMMGSTMMRRKSTKLWGQRVVEVKPERRSRIPSSNEHINMSHQHQEQRTSSNEPINQGTDVQWIRGKLIGKGSFGRVYLAFNVVSGEVIAVKQVEIPRTKSDRLDVHQNDMVDALYREIAMLRDLDHEYIVQYLGYGVDEQEAVVNIFLEYVSGGNIASRLALQGAFDEPLVRHFTRQVCEGLAYLHTRHILHRDIKSANILVEADGVCKISDFGLSKKNDYDEVYDQNSRMSLRGSVYWMAPEVVKNEPYSAKVDIWSLGCTVIEMFTGQRPWMTFNQIAALYNLGHHNAPDMPEHASDIAKDFLKKCFTIDPKYRPTALELLDHPFCALDPTFEFKDYVDKGKV